MELLAKYRQMSNKLFRRIADYNNATNVALQALNGLGKKIVDGPEPRICFYDNGCGSGPKHGARCLEARKAVAALLKAQSPE